MLLCCDGWGVGDRPRGGGGSVWVSYLFFNVVVLSRGREIVGLDGGGGSRGGPSEGTIGGLDRLNARVTRV